MRLRSHFFSLFYVHYFEKIVGWYSKIRRKTLTNTITFDFDYNHNIFETLTPYYPHITNINYNTNTPSGNPEITITFTTPETLDQFKTENYL